MLVFFSLNLLIMVKKWVLAEPIKYFLRPLAMTPQTFKVQSTTFILLSFISLRIIYVMCLVSELANFGTEAALTNSSIILVF